MLFAALRADSTAADRARELVSSLADDLGAAAFRVDALEELFGEDGGVDVSAALRRGHRAPALARLDALDRLDLEAGAAGRGPLATLARLFVLGSGAPAAAVEQALPALGLAGAVELGILSAPDDGIVRANLDLRPYAFEDVVGRGEWWIASDLGELAVGGALREDHVLGVGGASLTLAGLLLQRPAERVLDLGTGSGILALHASREAAHVVATDISERALDIAAFNFALNGIGSVELRHGSLYDPVADEQFDRIVSNPPFVITPRAEGVPAYEYRDGGLEGDALVESVLRGIAGRLRVGGIAQLLGNWEYRDGVPGLDRVRGWLEDSGLEYWIVEREQQDPSEYAETWIRDGGTRPGTAEFEALHHAWIADFARRGVTGVGFGYVLLRRRADGSEPRLRRLEKRHGPLGDNPAGVGAHLDACLSAWDALDGIDRDALARTRFRVGGDVTEERHHWPGAEDPTVILLHQGGGFGRVLQADTALAAFVGACDGELPAGLIVGAIATLAGVDEQELWDDLAPRLPDLALDGILMPNLDPNDAPGGLTVPLHE
ncbi:DUF7059 domain-containing protein [Agromyces seonyuensis]|uniref:Methyltransferase n=1 Tax=Agromyces seonyuensis TaxID=2662446 RepID=A0A6I4P0A9_9MICO|nr:methyltransferase [Agromyces seonyuensis]MWB99821.1 methyltransferase [Agromyces seonyuensis]